MECLKAGQEVAVRNEIGMIELGHVVKRITPTGQVVTGLSEDSSCWLRFDNKGLVGWGL